MATYVGFLRAINLGKTRKFPKDAIVRATEAAGFADAATYINTGNVRLSTSLRSRAKMEAALEAAYLAETGFEVPTIVFSAAELTAIAAYADELAATWGTPERHYVSLLKDSPSADLVATMEAASLADERVVVQDRAVHLLFTGQNYLDAKVTNPQVEKVLGTATNRNLTVIRAVAAKWCAG
jgi:uncharacterized protein (DUF1697 family)